MTTFLQQVYSQRNVLPSEYDRCQQQVGSTYLVPLSIEQREASLPSSHRRYPHDDGTISRQGYFDQKRSHSYVDFSFEATDDYQRQHIKPMRPKIGSTARKLNDHGVYQAASYADLSPSHYSRQGSTDILPVEHSYFQSNRNSDPITFDRRTLQEIAPSLSESSFKRPEKKDVSRK